MDVLKTLNELIPKQIRHRSGKVFYSGKAAFTSPSPLYVLGVNPGGDPARYEAETIEAHTANVLHHLPANWSAYRDESWEGAAPGTWGMAPRVLHLFSTLGLEPGR